MMRGTWLYLPNEGSLNEFPATWLGFNLEKHRELQAKDQNDPRSSTQLHLELPRAKTGVTLQL